MLDNLYNRALREYIYVYIFTCSLKPRSIGPPEWHRVKKVWKFHMQRQKE